MGSIITFYSYKGGTGRSMLLANVAWLLAANGQRVLTIDWDLEAPGLHRYFKPFLIDPEMIETDGLIDAFWKLTSSGLAHSSGESVQPTLMKSTIDMEDYTSPINWNFHGKGVLDFVG